MAAQSYISLTLSNEADLQLRGVFQLPPKISSAKVIISVVLQLFSKLFIGVALDLIAGLVPASPITKSAGNLLYIDRTLVQVSASQSLSLRTVDAVFRTLF